MKIFKQNNCSFKRTLQNCWKWGTVEKSLDNYMLQYLGKHVFQKNQRLCSIGDTQLGNSRQSVIMGVLWTWFNILIGYSCGNIECDYLRVALQKHKKIQTHRLISKAYSLHAYVLIMQIQGGYINNIVVHRLYLTPSESARDPTEGLLKRYLPLELWDRQGQTSQSPALDHGSTLIQNLL